MGTPSLYCRDEARAALDLRRAVLVGVLFFISGASLLTESIARLLRGGPVPLWVDVLFGVLAVALFGGACVFGVLVVLTTHRQYRATAGVCFSTTPDALICERPGETTVVPWSEITRVVQRPGLLRFAEHDTYRIEHAAGALVVDSWIEARERLVETVQVCIGELPEDWPEEGDEH